MTATLRIRDEESDTSKMTHSSATWTEESYSPSDASTTGSEEKYESIVHPIGEMCIQQQVSVSFHYFLYFSLFFI